MSHLMNHRLHQTYHQPRPVLSNRNSVNQHAEEHRILTNRVNMDDALKTQVLDAVEEPYVSELRNRYTGYMGVTTRDLLDHLMD